MFRGGPFENDRFLWMSAGTYVQGRLRYSSAFPPGSCVCFRPSLNVYWEIARSALLKTIAPSLSHSVRFLLVYYTPTTKCGGLYWIRFVPSVGQSVGRSVRPSPIRVRSITPLLMEGFPSNLNDTFTWTRGCAEPMLSMCQLKVNVTVKGKKFNKQTLHITSCLIYNSFTNGRISFKLEWHIHLN